PSISTLHSFPTRRSSDLYLEILKGFRSDLNLKRIRGFINTRIGFLCLLIALFWIKTILVYLIDFHLGVKGVYQYFVMLINPFARSEEHTSELQSRFDLVC